MLNRKTRIGTIGLASLLAAALSVGLAATAAAGLAPEMEERLAGLGFEAGALGTLDAAQVAGIVTLLEAGHDDDTLMREIGAILDTDGEAAPTG